VVKRGALFGSYIVVAGCGQLRKVVVPCARLFIMAGTCGHLWMIALPGIAAGRLFFNVSSGVLRVLFDTASVITEAVSKQSRT